MAIFYHFSFPRSHFFLCFFLFWPKSLLQSSVLQSAGLVGRAALQTLKTPWFCSRTRTVGSHSFSSHSALKIPLCFLASMAARGPANGTSLLVWIVSFRGISIFCPQCPTIPREMTISHGLPTLLCTWWVLYLRTPAFISGQVLGCSFYSSYRLFFILSLFSFASPEDVG